MQIATSAVGQTEKGSRRAHLVRNSSENRHSQDVAVSRIRAIFGLVRRSNKHAVIQPRHQRSAETRGYPTNLRDERAHRASAGEGCAPFPPPQFAKRHPAMKRQE